MKKEYNGGMGSNGLTSARHDVFGKYLAEKYPESYDAAVPEELVYSGGLKLTDSVEGSPIDAGKLVLSPYPYVCSGGEETVGCTPLRNSWYGSLLRRCANQSAAFRRKMYVL